MHARVQDVNFIHFFDKCWLNVYNTQETMLGVRDTKT